MTSREILTLQFGHYANFVGAHWWNIQESGFEYNATEPSVIDHGVLFREGLTSKGHVTFTPRLLLVDLKNSLKSLPKEGDLYESPPDPGQLTAQWEEDKVELQEDQREPQNEFQQDLNNPQTLPEVSMKMYNLDDSIEVWSDFLYSRFHPRTVNIVNDYCHLDEEAPFNCYNVGWDMWKTDIFEDAFSDKIRNYVEECDQFQGFHVLTDCTDGFAGLSSACLEHLRDEYDRKSVLVLPVIPSYFLDNDFQTGVEQVKSIMNDSKRVLNTVISFNQYRQCANMFVPLCTSQDGWRQPGQAREFYCTQYNPKLPYHSSAILASALDTISLKYRLKSSNFSILDLCADLTGNGRKVAAGSVCLPFSFNSDVELIDCLEHWKGPLYKSITPRCSIGTDRIMQHLTLRGIPESRLKKPDNRAGKQKEMQAFKCKTVKEMMEFYLSCTTYATASNVTTVQKPMPTKNPFPNIFDQYIGIDGQVYASARLQNTKVESVPVLAGFHSGSEIGEMLQSLYDEAKKIKIARFHHYTIERDEYEQCLDDILSLRENYEDSYLV